jgi:hypothetical protein
MKEENLSKDIELLTWHKYLSKSTNPVQVFLSDCLAFWIFDYVDVSHLPEIVMEDFSVNELNESIPLASCLEASSNPTLNSLGKHFFTVFDGITTKTLEMKNEWSQIVPG